MPPKRDEQIFVPPRDDDMRFLPPMDRLLPPPLPPVDLPPVRPPFEKPIIPPRREDFISIDRIPDRRDDFIPRMPNEMPIPFTPSSVPEPITPNIPMSRPMMGGARSRLGMQGMQPMMMRASGGTISQDIADLQNRFK